MARVQRSEDLRGLRGQAGAHGGVDCAPVAGDVGVFAGEEEGVGDGFGHLQRGVEASGGDVAVGSEGVWVVAASCACGC